MVMTACVSPTAEAEPAGRSGLAGADEICSGVARPGFSREEAGPGVAFCRKASPLATTRTLTSHMAGKHLSSFGVSYLLQVGAFWTSAAKIPRAALRYYDCPFDRKQGRTNLQAAYELFPFKRKPARSSSSMMVAA